MNESPTCANSDAKLTQPRSGFDLEEVSSQLTRLRNKFGAPWECRGGWQPNNCTGECGKGWRDPDAEYERMRDEA